MATEIDVEDENILTSIFKDSFPESWQENPDFLQYLVELSSYGAERLSREPERLSEEKAQILAETQSLAFHNYTTFIQTADCSKEIFQDFVIIEQHLEELISKLPEMSTQCNNVVNKAQEISASRRMNSLTLQRHTQLLEVLEMPQLMDTCVRNGYTEEALELGAHVKRLEKKHGNIPVIASIVKEVKSSTQLMLSQLIQQLRTNLQLPACLRVIGFLRRMDVFSEAELRITFLQARDAWFQSILEAVPHTDPYTHISKTIEASRVHLFDIMTQFRAIFSDEDPLISSGKVEPVNQNLIFHSWVLQKISQFLATLEQDLAEAGGGRLDSILGQCMYFGLSFSRVGADFRGLLAPIFERAALSHFTEALKDANHNFEENMKSYNLLGFTTTGGLPFGTASQSGQLYPPTTLLDFYPLAAYCNQALSAFNDLRLCSPLTLACQVAKVMETSLLEVNRIILAFYRAEETTFNVKEKDQFEQFCAGFVTDLLPYLNKCLQALFPPGQIAQALGMSVSDMNKKAFIGQVDITKVLVQIQHLMPAAPTPPASDTMSEAGSQGQPVTFMIESDDEDKQNDDSKSPPPSQENSKSPPPAETEAQTSSDSVNKDEKETTNTNALESKPSEILQEASEATHIAADSTENSSSQMVPSDNAPTGNDQGAELDVASADTNLVTPDDEPDQEKESQSLKETPESVIEKEKVIEAPQNNDTIDTDAAQQSNDDGWNTEAGWNTADGWNTDGIDLDNLDEMTLDPQAGDTIDLDSLPSLDEPVKHSNIEKKQD